MSEHVMQVRVYYEDTDLAGIVYYANYFKYIERGRSEWVRARGIDQTRQKDETGTVFAVRRVEADYIQPARFDDLLEVRTRLASTSGVRFVMEQDVVRDGEVLFRATVTIVAIGPTGRPARLPADIRRNDG